MSYDIDLVDPVSREVIELEEKHYKYASVNVTYNYSVHFYKTIDKEKGIRFLYGMSGAESIPVLVKAINKLGDDTNDDYWKPTEGNARKALLQLLLLAYARPEGIWEGD
ncbi:MAG TPA: hypothetical protein VMX17_07850 [Candidatus Glassbacteria bacterium]|nr:hypothetical protein [Candidatus Glassbacteria bacterium]